MAASYDLISTHTKYAPSQRQWLTPLDHELDESELEMFTPRTLELARIDGLLYGVPRNLDVKLLYYRTDLMDGPPSSWEQLRDEAARLKSDDLYGFVFPGKESGSSATSSSCSYSHCVSYNQRSCVILIYGWRPGSSMRRGNP